MSDLTNISWTTDTYRIYLASAWELIHAWCNLCQLDNGYMSDLTNISWTTDTCWIQLASSWELIHAGCNFRICWTTDTCCVTDRCQKHTHTTNTCITGDGLVTRQISMQRSFKFWLKRKEWRRMPDRNRKGVPEHRSKVLKGSLPQGPPAHPRNMQDVSICSWAKRVRRRAEMK